MFLMLDSGPLSEATRPLGSPVADWIGERTSRGDTVVVPEVCDYELRRELHRAGKDDGLLALDVLVERAYYRTLDTPTLHLAAQLWAEARASGRPTASNAALDIDTILAAQAQTLTHVTGRHTIVVTTNPAHLVPFVDARRWEDI